MWRGPVQAETAWPVFIAWVAGVKSDKSPLSAHDKVVKNKPGAAVDGCWVAGAGKAPEFIAERQTFSSKPDSRCNEKYSSAAFTRYVAGGPLDANVLKCQLKPIEAKAYASFTQTELQRLRTIFPGGTCDFSKPGVNQTRVVPWASFGPAPADLIFDIRQRKTPTDITKR